MLDEDTQGISTISTPRYGFFTAILPCTARHENQYAALEVCCSRNMSHGAALS